MIGLVTRRRWLVGLGVAVVLGACSRRLRLGPWRPKSSAAELALVRRINAIANEFNELYSLGDVQQHYFARESAGELLARLFPERPLEEISRLSDAKLVDSLRLASHSDFDAGRVVMVAGWLLSRTEAQLCLLAVT